MRPTTSYGHLQSVLDRYLNFPSGFFVEAEANDGISQSNIYYLARRKGWSGILIEPIPELASIAKRWRPDAVVENLGLVAPEESGRTVRIVDLDLQSVVLQNG